ncbi:MAG: hypothetical protein CMF96_01165 [Candidatus Marinimicrobia bacterium]|nr:hypothetical protein [Candidatus Neomarinimicrobiota bacterium]|tara:strand:- start:2741 stop:3442 length:702 start_codon:yes stop_codon:yes gene_type:complete
MKILLKKIIYLLFISQIFAIAGFGLYGDNDFLSHNGNTDSENYFTIKSNPFNNTYGGGFYIYIDAIPFIDLEINGETALNLHESIFSAPNLNIDFEGKLPWARTSLYLTARKKIVGLSVPFLAKARLFAGGGMNMHRVTPEYTLDLLLDAYPDENGLEDIFDLINGDTEALKTLGSHVKDNMNSITGIHLQTGLQAKLLMLDMFLNARYTLAKDIIPGRIGFPSLWLGIGIGI